MIRHLFLHREASRASEEHLIDSALTFTLLAEALSLVLESCHCCRTGLLVIGDSIADSVGKQVLFSFEHVRLLAAHERLAIGEQHGVGLRIGAVGLLWGLNSAIIVVKTSCLCVKLTLG